MALKWTARVALLFALLGITVLSLGPVESLPRSGLLSWDKAQHFLAYLVLASLAILSFRRQVSVWCVIAVGVFSLCIELLQPGFGREFDVGDLVANLLGVCLALLVVPGLAARLRLI